MWRPWRASTGSRTALGRSSEVAERKWFGQMSEVAPNQKMLMPVSRRPLSGIAWGMTTS